MQKIIYCTLVVYVYIASCFAGNVKTTLSGKVTDKASGESLIGATVYIPDLKTGAITGLDGHYKIENLPASKFIVQVKYLGYSSITQSVDLSKTIELDFQLQPTVIEQNEVVVTGSAFTTDNKRSSVSVVSIDKLQLLSVHSGNIITQLAKTPGVSEITTGNAISKPVIRGLGYNRIVIVNEGVRQEGQQWGDEHGIEIDQFAADRIEILKGPSSLLYGSDALGGVINILEPLPALCGKIQGAFTTNFSSNNGLSANSLMAEGNEKGFVWRMRGTFKSSAAYKTPVEKVYNTGFNESSGNLMIGLNKSWGYSHLHASRWNANIGLTEGERDSVSGKFTDASGNIVSESDLNSRKLFIPMQNIQHTKLTSVNNFILGKKQLRINVGWQQNSRKEFEELSDIPGLFFQLNTLTYDLKFYPVEKNGFETVIGLNGMKQNNQNNGDEFLIPDYTFFDAGVFISVKKSFDSTTFNAGMRYDTRNITGKKLIADTIPSFPEFNSAVSAITGSIGFTHQFNKALSLKGNIGRGFRAPNISELSANGVHEGTFRYEIGDPDLEPETSIQCDATVSLENKNWHIDISGFYNMIDNYIYYRNLDNETINIKDEVFPVYRYAQGNAVLLGFEFSSDIHLIEHLHFENNASFVQGKNNNTENPLPFIPAVKIENEIKYEFELKKWKRVQSIFLKAGVENYLKQNRIDVFETETNGYTLLNAAAGINIKVAKQVLFFSINGNNLSDKKYYNHLSRLKEKGISDMGRNITFSIHLPFGIL